MIKVVNIKKYDGDDVAYIGRGSPLENIYSSKKSKFSYVIMVATSEIAIELYKEYLLKKIKNKDRVILYELKLMIQYYEKHGTLALGCFCKDEHGNGNCHGDFVKEILERAIKLKQGKKNA